jgi:hypothetical protein
MTILKTAARAARLFNRAARAFFGGISKGFFSPSEFRRHLRMN